jgi:hypothetical protein
MVSEYKGSATQRLSTVMPIIIVIALVLADVHKYAIWCNTEDFAVKPSIKRNSTQSVIKNLEDGFLVFHLL